VQPGPESAPELRRAGRRSTETAPVHCNVRAVKGLDYWTMPLATDVIEAWLSSDRPAVVFDFNGTLSDDEHILFDIFSELFRDHLGWAMTAEDYRAELLGHSDREIIERAVARHGRGTDEEVSELLRLRQGVYKQRVADHNPIGAAAAQLVKLLADNQIPVGIVTGAQRDDV